MKRIVTALVFALAVIALCGCFRMTAEELYSLPRASDEFLKLQTQIDAVLNSGAEYSPPTGGSNRQSVQLKDIDGDGRNEAIAFFTMPGDKPLKIYIFTEDADNYVTADIIEGMGTAIESVRYIDLDGDGTLELVVGWQMGSALQHMTLYSMKSLLHTKIAEADYTGLTVCDVTGDGNGDLVAVRLATAETPGEAEAFSLMSDGEVVTSTARLSNGVESLSRVMTGRLSDGASAVFVDGKYEGGTITDIFACRDASLKNVSAVAPGGASASTARAITVYASDINRDGIMEVPFPELLPQQSETNYYVINWRSFDKNGTQRHVQSTYHNYSDGWYIILEDSWRGRITVRREDAVSGERTLVFSVVRGGRVLDDFLKVYTLSGDNRDDRARLPGRFRLLEDGDIVFAAEITLPDGSTLIDIDRDTVISNFRIIYSDWITGAI